MEELMEILNNLHPDVDFAGCKNLVDGKILDSFDIITIISEVAEVFDVTISAKYIVPENFNSAEALWNLVRRLEEDE